MLPGQQAVLFTITPPTGGVDASQIALLDLRDTKRPPKIILRGGSQAKYVPCGHLVYAAGGTLRAVAFDLATLETRGTAVPVQTDIVTLPTGTAEFDISLTGTLVYATGGVGYSPPRALVWVDRQGREEPVKGAPIRTYVHPRVSPDGSRIAVDTLDQENDIWLWDIARQTLSRVSTDPNLDQTPIWMPNGRQLLYSSQAEGIFSLARQSADGTGSVEYVSKTTNPLRLSGVSPDGNRVVASIARPVTALDVMVLNLDKRSEFEPLLRTPFLERNAELSPDSRWLAYESNDTGQFQIYVRPYPDVDKERIQVSTSGGSKPLWSRDGRELFYIEGEDAIVSLRIGAGSTWTVSRGTRTPVATNTYFMPGERTAGRTYDVSPDGKRFLMVKAAGASQPTVPASIVVVRNWIEELKRLVPVR
jgi:serine/threonine-protein kinase